MLLFDVGFFLAADVLQREIEEETLHLRVRSEFQPNGDTQRGTKCCLFFFLYFWLIIKHGLRHLKRALN